jgi:hypothetical protein
MLKGELNPKLKLWRDLLEENGINGVLGKSDLRYPAIKAQYKKLLQKS